MPFSNPEEKKTYDHLRYLGHRQEKIDLANDWRKNNFERAKELQRKCQKKWRENNRDYKQTPKYKAKMNKQTKAWRENNPEKVIAERLANNRHLPLEKYCELCPEDDRQLATDRHHPDHSIYWLYISCCKSCHKWAERKLDMDLDSKPL